MPIILRFRQGSDFNSKAIVALEKTAMPFTPSHAEAVTPDGLWLGALFKDGVQERPAGYDKATTAHELFLTLPATDDQSAQFYAFLRSHVGEPYDWKAIAGFLIPHSEHTVNHTICSALITNGLRVCKWYKWPLAAPFHLIDPRDLLLMISTVLEVPMG